MGLGFVGLVDDHGRSAKRSPPVQWECPSADNPADEEEDDRDAEQAPAGGVAAGDDVELAEGFGVVEIPGDVGAEGDRGEPQEDAEGIYPESAVLVEPGVHPAERAAAGVHAGQGPEGDHLVGLIAVEAVAEENPGSLGVGLVQSRAVAA